MATTNKRRKLEGFESSAPSTPIMSGLSARQQLLSAASSLRKKSADKSQETRSKEADAGVSTPVIKASANRRNKRQPAKDGQPSTSVDQQPDFVYDDDTSSIPPVPVLSPPLPGTPRIEPKRQIALFSSFKLNKKNYHHKPDGRILLSTPGGERMVILGSYGLKVQQGEAVIAGAILTASDDIQWIHAPHCHALPVLRTREDTVVELHPHPSATSLHQLARLNPVFGRLWNEGSTTGPPPNKAQKALPTFQIIFSSDDAPKRVVLQELVSPPEWNKKLANSVAAKRKTTPVIFLCGPKSSGKSTFGRLLLNQFITDRAGAKTNPWSAAFVLDLDPGQPEFAPPGVISLSKITCPNLSPSFCHPTLEPTKSQLRSHAIASVTPGADPSHFLECALDLFSTYKNHPDSKSTPLIINTPGWILGTGLDILSDLITFIAPSEAIYLSKEGPRETVSSLQLACTSSHTVFSTLPSQNTTDTTSPSRIALEYRTMHTMSYFHLTSTDSLSQLGGPNTAWNPSPLSDLRPWRVRYTGPPSERGFLGILCYDHQPAPGLLGESINGMVLALVRIESRAAFRGFLKDGQDEAGIQPAGIEKLPLIQSSQTLDPKYSKLLGLVMVRGIDAVRGELQLLTPLSREILAGGNGEKTDLVLVAGKFDTPTWVYTEDLYRKAFQEGEEAVEDDGNSSGEEEEGVDVDGGVPWVEMLHGSEKRGVGSKVWRVRRDLGRR
ncbi:hypothetical protein QBC35DRAFT_484573 [Podospora australis]|uniref:Polynucleotide 5'-hydroxyl-kinase GRC3 n=1 Tax=Podospora australis TaxID=1536484 RepID=A0AAN6X231_9PEZI|nr:hypothetical protein QBC35DRAFT_484573 [Podospora australis]